jgi:hypothetical protein
MILRSFAFLVVATLVVGCNRWDSKPGHYIGSTNAMASVSTFIATYGWNSCTNDEDLCRWEDSKAHNIQDVPWTKYKGQEFPALTHNGILYVLSNPGWHGDYGGLAYNPATNQFPVFEGFGFKPIGGHWYVWCIPELSGGMNLPHIYE